MFRGTSSFGASKVESAQSKLVDISLHIQIDIYNEPFTSENALRSAETYDDIIDGTDNLRTRCLVNIVLVLLGKTYPILIG